MRKIIIIGTLHAGLTPEKELQKVLAKYTPSQLLVEIVHEDLNNAHLNSYPPEMIFAYNWAKSKNIQVSGFDSKINVITEGMTNNNNLEAISEQKKIMKKYTWIDMNKEDNLKKLNTPTTKKLIDSEKEKTRNIELLKNIKRKLIKKGTILILTGVSHLKYFETKLKDAQFPFRK